MVKEGIIMKKIFKIAEIFTAIIFGVLLVIGGIIVGIQTEQKNVTKSIQAETVTKIAVVNLDEGIKTENKQIFYAERLMDFSNENLIASTLEEARTGIENGSYAGYVIIPANFSKDATSLNTNPQKSTLTCT